MSEKERIERKAIGRIEGTGDGRTLDLRVVPYGVVARVTDNGRDYYDEVWEPGCFDKQSNAANRILVNFEHQRGIGGVIGHGRELNDSQDGLHGTFRMMDKPDADKALELVNEGILTGVSLEAEPIKTERVDGVVKRVKARLVNVALCRAPAFHEAQVLAVREGELETPDEAPPLTAEPEDEPDPDEERPSDVVVQQDGEAAVVAIADRQNEVDELLQRIGYEPLTKRAVTRKPWNGAASKYADAAAYCSACLIDDNPSGEDKVIARCHLPVYEPNGDLNANALSSAAGRLNQTQSPQKAAAARKLVRLYRQAGMPIPPSLQSAASR